MRKGLIAASVLAGALLFSTVGCNQTPSKPVDKSVYTVSIDNKEELQAEWLSDDPGRSLSITITKDGVEQNATKAIQDGDLTFNVADTTVAKINGKVVSPVGEGTTTVTANYKNVSDSVQITITYSDPHGKSADDPLSVEEAVEICKETGETQTNIEYYVSGIVSNVGDPWNPDYENITFDVVDSLDKKDVWVRCYRVVKADGAEFDPTKIALGSEVMVKGYLVNYKGNTPEMPQGSQILSATEGQQAQTIEATVAEALAVAMALDANSSTNDKYVVTGYITAVKAGSGFYMSDTKGAVDPSKDQFLVYYGNNAMPADATVNAKVKVTAPLKHYVSSSNPDNYAYETSGSKPEAYELLEAGDVPAEGIKVTVAEALALIKAVPAPSVEDFGSGTNLSLEVNKGALYEVTGYVTKLGSWSDKYNNGDAYIADAAGDVTNTLQVFRINDKALFDKLVVDQTQLKVTSSLIAFYKLVEGVVTFSAAETAQAPACEIVSGGDTPVATVVTVAEALALIKAVPAPSVEDFGDKANLSLDVNEGALYEVTGYVTKLGSWSDKYSNGDAYIADAAGDVTNTLQVFRINDKALFDQLVVDQTQLKVTSKLVAFYKLVEGVVTFSAAETAQAPACEIVSGGGEVPPEPPVTDVVLAAGTNGSACKVVVGGVENAGIKVGTGSKAGDMTMTVPASATKVTFHAAAWNGKTAVLSVSAVNADVDQESLTLNADTGIAGNTPFTLAGEEANYVCVLNLSNVTGEVVITLATSDTANGRFVVWGATAE